MEFKSTQTVCPYCGCGCTFYLQTVDGKLVGTVPSETGPVNQGKLCVKGWNAHEFVQSAKRLTTPMMRKGEDLQPASWDEALDFTANRLREIKEKYGPRSIAFLASAKITNEENYLLQKFARAAVGTNSVDHCARL